MGLQGKPRTLLRTPSHGFFVKVATGRAWCMRLSGLGSLLAYAVLFKRSSQIPGFAPH